MRNISLFIAILTTVVLAGCSGKLATVMVTGTITYEGKPLADAEISFSPVTEGKGHPAYGITDGSGKYVLQTILGDVGAGTTPGEYMVTVAKLEKPKQVSQAPQTDSSGRPIVTAASLGPPPRLKSFIPDRYASVDTSELTATVERKRNNVIDFVLTK